MVLGMLGLGEQRLVIHRMPRGDGSDFVKQVKNFIEGLEQLRKAVPARVK